MAAPLSSQTLLKWLETRHPRYILDLRGESATDPLSPFPQAKSLREIFLEIEENREKLSGRIKAAQQTLTELTTQWEQAVQVRPFGWDDVCA